RYYGFNRFLEELDDMGHADGSDQPAAPVQTEYLPVLDMPTLDDMVAQLEAADLICLDTETDALSAMRSGLVGLSFAVKPEQAWYVPVGHDYLGAPEQLPVQTVL